MRVLSRGDDPRGFCAVRRIQLSPRYPCSRKKGMCVHAGRNGYGRGDCQQYCCDHGFAHVPSGMARSANASDPIERTAGHQSVPRPRRPRTKIRPVTRRRRRRLARRPASAIHGSERKDNRLAECRASEGSASRAPFPDNPTNARSDGQRGPDGQTGSAVRTVKRVETTYESQS